MRRGADHDSHAQPSCSNYRYSRALRLLASLLCLLRPERETMCRPMPTQMQMQMQMQSRQPNALHLETFQGRVPPQLQGILSVVTS